MLCPGQEMTSGGCMSAIRQGTQEGGGSPVSSEGECEGGGCEESVRVI